MELEPFKTFVKGKQRSSGGAPVLFPRFGPVDRTIHINAEQDWVLTGVAPGARQGDPPRDFSIHLPKGVYTFDFPARSENLTYVVIDPDPGSPEPI